MDANKIKVIDDNGKELEFDVLFTFESDDTGKKYVLYYDATAEEPQVIHRFMMMKDICIQ